MLTIPGATHTLTEEMMVLCVALVVFVLGIIMIAVDVARRNRRRIEAENRPIDTSLFQQLNEATAAAEAAAAQDRAAAADDEVIPLAAADEISPPPLENPAPLQSGPADIHATNFDIMPPEDAPPALESAGRPYPAAITDEPAMPPLADSAPLAAAAFDPAPPAYMPIRPVLICENFGAGFGSKIVLSDVSFEVLDHGITTLMGPIGTGKSTLLRALAGMLGQSGLFKDWGAAWFQGVPLGPDNRPLLVSQRIQLIQRSALENLTFHLRDRVAGLPRQDQLDWATQWLTQAGAPDLIAQLDRPFIQLDQLSQRIIAILREAAAEPALLLIDEPTNGLAETEAAVLLTMLERLAGFTPLLVALQSHKHARRISNQIILLAGGRVQASCDAVAFFDTPPNPLVAQFIATGLCNVPAPDASAIVERPPADPDAPPPLTPAALAAIKDEIRGALAMELSPQAAAFEPALPEDEASAPGPIEPTPGPAAPEPEIQPTEPAPEPAPPEPEITPHTPGPEIAPTAPEPEIPAVAPEPSPVEPAPIPPTVSEAEVLRLETLSEPSATSPVSEQEPSPDTMSEPAFETMPESPMPDIAPAAAAAEAEPEPAPEILPLALEPNIAPAAHEPEIIPDATEPAPVEPSPIPETVAYAPDALPELAIPESLLAEPMAFPIAFAPFAPTPPQTIDMEPDFTYEKSEPVFPDAWEPGTADDLPAISLSPQMIQSMPLPPRAAGSQMGVDRAADQLRKERAAVMRFPGSASPGPRGFVWIEDGRLAATPMPGITAAIDHDLGLLKDAGITVLITLTEQDFPQDVLAQHGLRNLHFPIADRKAPSTGETDVLVNRMHDMLDSGEVLAVHCLAGLGRTGTILAAYMVKEKGVSAQVALNQIRHFNRQFVQTADQEDFLVEYEVQQEQTVLLNRAAPDGARLLK